MLKTLNGLVFRSNQSSGEADCEYFASLPRFPISTEAELKLFDEYLRAEDNLERAVYEINNSKHFLVKTFKQFPNSNQFLFQTKYFSLIGGSSKEQIIREILKRLLSRDIALSISFTGKGKGNISFSQFSKVWCMILST